MITRGLNHVKQSLGDVEKYLSRFISTGGDITVLEIGCGIGNALSDLSDIYPQITLYGMNKKRYSDQVIKSNIYYLFGDAGIHIPLEDNSIDFAFSIHAIQFVEDKAGLLKEAHRVLKNQGEFRVFVPETLPGINGEILCTVSDKNRTDSLQSYLMSLQNPNISFYKHRLGRYFYHMRLNILKITKLTKQFDLYLQEEFSITDLGKQFPEKEGYKSSHYKLIPEMKLSDLKKKVLVVAASPHGYGHLYRGEMISDFLSENNYDVYYLSNNSVNDSLANTNHFSDFKIDMTANQLDNDAKDAIAKYFNKTEFEYIIIENFPLGKLFLLEGFKVLHQSAKKNPKYICAFRDVFSIDDLIDIEKSSQILNQYFDKLIVFSDKSFIELPEVLTSKIKIPLSYVGYLDNTYTPQITIFGGGGKYNFEFYKQTLEVIQDLNLTKQFAVRLFTGKTLQSEQYQSLKRTFPDIIVKRHSDDLLSEISASDITISTFGYNTFVQLMKFNNYNVIVPLPKNHQEQYTRAEKFAVVKDKVKIILLDSVYKKELSSTLKTNIDNLIDRNGLNRFLNELNNWK